MIYQSYWDDSEDDASKFFGVGGFVGSENEWKALESRWLEALPDGIDYFHATDCFTGNNQFEPSKGFPKPVRLELLNQLTDLICETDIKLICSAIDVPYYVQIAGKRQKDQFLGPQYIVCFNEDLGAACRDYMQPKDEPEPIETGDVCAIFYEEGPHSDSVPANVRMWRNDELLWWRSRIGNPVPGTKTGSGAIPLLQVADLGAFLGTKWVAEARDGAIPWRPYFEKLYKAGKVWALPRLSKHRISFLRAIFNIQQKPDILKDAIQDVWPDTSQ